MDASVVVCTRNRAPVLGYALERFGQLQARETFELVIVDNGSTDATNQMLQQFAKTCAIPTSVLFEPRPGLSVARNTGWHATKGKVVIFTDDDCYPSADFVSQTIACFTELGIGYLGGRILLHDPADYPITIQPLDQQVLIPARSYVPLGLIHGANFSFLREAMTRIGPFDERLGAGTRLLCGEDIDYLARASAAGLKGAYDPRPLVWHHHRRRSPQDIEKISAGYDVGRGAYFAKSLLHSSMRGRFVWPVVRRIGGNLVRGDFAVLGREAQGAWSYLKAND